MVQSGREAVLRQALAGSDQIGGKFVTGLTDDAGGLLGLPTAFVSVSQEIQKPKSDTAI